MDEVVDNSLSRSCRTCLQLQPAADEIEEDDAKIQMRSIKTIWNDSIEFYGMLQYLLNNSRSSLNEKHFPTKICAKCEQILIESYKFKKMCIENEVMLDKYLLGKLQFVENVKGEFDGSFREKAADRLSVIEDEFKEMDYVGETSINWDSTSEGKAEEMFCKDEEIDEGSSVLQVFNDVAIKEDEDIIELDDIETKPHGKDENLRRCRLCNIEFNDVKEYQCHHRQVHRAKTLCPFCGILVSKHTMEKHIVSHTKAKDHLCTECGKSFTLSENLKKHWRIHTGDKRYTCEHCGDKFIHWNSKRSHIRTMHTGEKKYACNICGKLFAQSSNMFRHVRQHTGELPHECRFCHKKFMTTTELRNHIVVHTGEKNELCEICKKAFGTRKALRTHMKTHTGERNYVCTVCSKAFTQAHVLRTHMKTHPNCPIPAPGVVLSQKALNRPPKFVKPNEIDLNENAQDCIVTLKS